MIQYAIGTYIEAKGRKRCITIIGKITDTILGGYQVQDQDTKITYHVRHSDFEIKEVKK